MKPPRSKPEPNLASYANRIFPDSERGRYRLSIVVMAGSGHVLGLGGAAGALLDLPQGEFRARESAQAALAKIVQEQTGGHLGRPLIENGMGIYITGSRPLARVAQGDRIDFVFMGDSKTEFEPKAGGKAVPHRWMPFHEWPQPQPPIVRMLAEHPYLSLPIRQSWRLRRLML